MSGNQAGDFEAKLDTTNALAQQVVQAEMPIIGTFARREMERMLAERRPNATMGLAPAPPKALGIAAAMGGPNPAQATQVGAKVGTWPYSAVGRLLAGIPGEQFSESGTAFVVGKRAILTAAHCVYSKFNLPRRRVFAQQVRVELGINGGAAARTLKLKEIRIHSMAKQLFDAENDNLVTPFDFAAGIFEEGGDFLNHLGVVPGPPTVQQFVSVGYPLFGGGSTMYESRGQAIGVPSSSNDQFAFATGMSFGASGGPVFSDLQNGLVCGINSATSNGHTVMNSPVFDSDWNEIFDWLSSKNAL